MRRKPRYRTPSSVLRRLVALAKHRAKKSGVQFDLSAEDLHLPTYCPALGIRLARNAGGRSAHAASPTLDRIDSRKGYVKGNVVVISHRANSIKSNASPKELERVAAYFRQLVS